MATTSIHLIRVTEAKSIKYIMNPDKAAYVTRYGCWGNAAEISNEFSKLRSMGRNIGSVLSYHIIQSFAPNEATAEQVHQAGLMLCDELFQGKYKYVLATHTDNEIVNNT
ncbi:relaxase/mobilization nuclease domain-containing protein [Hominisplanchenecus sp.]|uniref:relaxase/mobilization nuclease domain-containing protein n=1 Tax=Hominisplanchenecus sp. TaxID=3038130 RepID=UPI0039938B8D